MLLRFVPFPHQCLPGYVCLSMHGRCHSCPWHAFHRANRLLNQRNQRELIKVRWSTCYETTMMVNAAAMVLSVALLFRRSTLVTEIPASQPS